MAEPATPPWDRSGLRSHGCTLATAGSDGESVVLNFGATAPGEAGAAIPVLHQRIGLSPQAAKHLHEMLGRLLAEHDAHARRPG